MQDLKRAEFSITGRVQGVGFRYFVYRQASKLGLTGYTKNLYDGSVETVAEGHQSALDNLHQYIKKGPSMSRVDRCLVEYKDYTGDFDSFNIL